MFPLKSRAAPGGACIAIGSVPAVAFPGLDGQKCVPPLVKACSGSAPKSHGGRKGQYLGSGLFARRKQQPGGGGGPS